MGFLPHGFCALATLSVVFPGAITYSISGGKVQDCIKQIALLLECHPSVHTVIVHTGMCDVMSRQSTKLQLEFECLTSTVENLGRTCVLSGPIPTLRHGSERFSKLFSLHHWLQNFCTAIGQGYVNHFDTFWGNPHLLRSDGLHPNRAGTK